MALTSTSVFSTFLPIAFTSVSNLSRRVVIRASIAASRTAAVSECRVRSVTVAPMSAPPNPDSIPARRLDVDPPYQVCGGATEDST